MNTGLRPYRRISHRAFVVTVADHVRGRVYDPRYLVTTHAPRGRASHLRSPASTGTRANLAAAFEPRPNAVVDHLTAQERLPTREQLLNDLLSLMACHSAVRSGDPLSPDEIAALVAQRHFAGDTHHCPHGRPTALLFTRHDLDRQFRRT